MTKIEFQYELINIQTSLMKFAYKLTLDKENARDLVQETYLKALKNQDKYINDDNIIAWTFTIMRNTFINNYRSSLRHLTFTRLTSDGFIQNYTTASGPVNPESIYSSDELEKIIDSLEDNFRLPFRMHHEGFKYREIAESLDLKLGTVKNRVFIARKKLIQKVNE